LRHALGVRAQPPLPVLACHEGVAPVQAPGFADAPPILHLKGTLNAIS